MLAVIAYRKSQGISLPLALEAYLATWLEALAAESEVQKEIREAYAHLPKFHASFHLSKQPVWIKAKGV